ncbi:NADP-dependent oxidoreductase [Nocardioides sp. cx-173]|uniref:NADP-dependent oxidoreductase n=1 Tax=Nocardioides sp. cx-173 TaxID=2898796 RepID=UPI001E4E859B|nr:NADP-dependent oxidoreductase [Nocardioides sp. cx-173]MCD4526843.1 NADP-dependent oxidoreductase [Nocardioides sp. cx-173]UGB43944.1 NADP-dependent oxidoreductase [Nocardioides sp. cx-173]
MPTHTREIHLSARPSGLPGPEHFRTVEVSLPDLGENEVLVRNTFLSVDPYMRGRMNDVKSYVPPFALDAPLDGGAVGVVEESRSDRLRPGDTVLHMAGWREHAVLPAAHARPLDTGRAPASAYLGVLGMPGLTAYVGLTRIAEMREGDTVYVSGAAGAVGSVAGQIARLLGAGKVVGSAGSREKVAWLVDELGFDAAFDYHDGPVAEQLAPHAPIDVYFDNVGGEHLEGAIFHMADFGRIAACGAIAGYNAEAPEPGPRNLMMIVTKRLTLRGFTVSNHQEAASDFYRDAGAWLAAGDLVYRETFVDGLDSMVDAFRGLYSGDNVGKMLVRL